MVQTNRSILLEVINPEKADLLTIITEENAKESLSDEQLARIHEKLTVSSFSEFITKFAPTVKMMLNTEQKQVAFSLGHMGDAQEVIELNHPDSLFNSLMYLIESKKHKRYLLTEFEDMMENVIPRRSSDLFFDERGQLISDITANGPAEHGSHVRRMKKLLHGYDDGIYLLIAFLKNVEAILLRGMEDGFVNRGIIEDHDQLQIKVLKTAERYQKEFYVGDHFDAEEYSAIVEECLESEKGMLRNPTLLRDCLLLPVYVKERKLELLLQKQKEYIDFYVLLLKRFWITSKPLLETLLGVWNFFAPHYGVEGMNPVLVVANFALADLMETKNRERLDIYLNSVNSKTFQDNTIWYAILPNMVTNTEIQGRNVRERFRSQREQYAFRRNGTEEIVLALEILARYKVQTFLSLSLTKENTFTAIARTGLDRLNENLAIFDKLDGTDYLIPCFPNFVVVSEEEACLNMGNNLVLCEDGKTIKAEGNRLLWLDEIGVEACYIAAGLFAACQDPNYLKTKFKRGVLENTPGVAYRFSEGGHQMATTTAMLSETIDFTEELAEEIHKHSRGVAFGQKSGKMIILTDRAYSYGSGNPLLASMVQTLSYVERVIQFESQDYKKKLISQFFQRRPGSLISQWYTADHTFVNAIIKENESIEYQIDENDDRCTFTMSFNNKELVRRETVAMFKE